MSLSKNISQNKRKNNLNDRCSEDKCTLVKSIVVNRFQKYFTSRKYIWQKKYKEYTWKLIK